MKQRGDWLVASRDVPLSTEIRGSEKKSLAGAWLTLVIPFGIGAFFMAWAHMPIFMKPGVPNPIAIVLGLVIVLLLGRAVWESLRLKRFGDPVLNLTEVPVPLGGTLEGRIALDPAMTTAPDFNLKLECVHRVLQQGGKNSHYVETVLWTGDKTASLLPGGLVTVSVPMPADQPETNSDNGFDCILWRLTVRAPFRGIAFLEKYEIPVRGRTSEAQKIADERERSGAVDPRLQPITGKKLFVSTLPFLVAGIAIAVGGFILLAAAISDMKQASASAAWPTVTGQILRSYSNGSRNKAPSITYNYEVNGVAHVGNTIYPHWFWTHSSSLRMAKAFPVNAQVPVHYSPSNPSESCLLAGYQPGAFQRLLGAAGVLVIAFLFGSTCVFAPMYGEMSGNTITYRKGSPASKAMGWSLLLILALGLAMWWVT